MIKLNFLENSEDQSDCQEKLNWPLNFHPSSYISGVTNKILRSTETVINEISCMFNQSEKYTAVVFYFLKATGA